MTITTAALARSSRRASTRWIPATPTSVTRETQLPSAVERDDRFLGDGKVARARGDDGDGALALRRAARGREDARCARARSSRCPGRRAASGSIASAGRRVTRSPCPRAAIARRDLADLLGRLPGAVYDFWKALPQRALVVDRREGERLRRLERQSRERVPDLERSVRDPLQQIANVLASHTSAVSSGSASAVASVGGVSIARCADTPRRCLRLR